MADALKKVNPDDVNVCVKHSISISLQVASSFRPLTHLAMALT